MDNQKELKEKSLRIVTLEKCPSDYDDDEIQVYDVCYPSDEDQIKNVENVSDKESRKKKDSQMLMDKNLCLFHGKWILYSFANYENRKGYDGKMIFFHVSIILSTFFM